MKKVFKSFLGLIAGTMLLSTSMVAWADSGSGQHGDLTFSTNKSNQTTFSSVNNQSSETFNDGQNIYVTLTNSHGHDKNINVPNSAYFYFNGPSNSGIHNEKVQGTLDKSAGDGKHLVYKLTVPSDFSDGQYNVNFSIVNNYYWIGSFDCHNPPVGQLPEFPYAGLAPLAILGAIGVGFAIRKRKARA